MTKNRFSRGGFILEKIKSNATDEINEHISAERYLDNAIDNAQMALHSGDYEMFKDIQVEFFKNAKGHYVTSFLDTISDLIQQYPECKEYVLKEYFIKHEIEELSIVMKQDYIIDEINSDNILYYQDALKRKLEKIDFHCKTLEFYGFDFDTNPNIKKLYQYSKLMSLQ
jgi:hypothetical protein